MRTRRLPPLSAIRAFDAVARHTSFKAAAEEIGVTPTAISHQIRVLETSLNQRLFTRSARAVVLTNAGEILFRASGNIFATLREAVEAIDRAGQPGALTLSTTSNFLTNWLVPRLPSLHQQHPSLELRLHSSTDLVDVRGDMADCAIRYSMQADEALENTLLYRDRFVLVASPQLALRVTEDLSRFTLFHIENRHVPQPEPDWPHWKAAFGPADLPVHTGIHFDDETHAIQAAIAGQGVLLASELLIQNALAQGLLRVALPGTLPGGNYYFVTSQQKAQREEVRIIKAWLQQAFANLDVQNNE
ncbi:LysR family transcriptional regulator, glycine cleavage system transcriptional activator [Kosakonia radicincitans]|uniref:LysR substrate-binding domain-containing protein n=1 Tax=Kosakonia radicincitans TaxID=283686 RepID=UPI0009A7DB6A|nr:LysR substrate-binding domain-containing protein [Kosakonia radicincitans]SKC05874.1 LysR family transcriptional regulator, glycine cleavage system transcriptional activator [Kosakonia radicincitans]